MEIYLIRHTSPKVPPGVCYGWSDLETTQTFHAEAAIIQSWVQHQKGKVYSSPLKRCKQLATHLFPEHAIEYQDHLKEIHCGTWELMHWNEIPADVLDPWLENRVFHPFPGGESYHDLYVRVTTFFSEILQKKESAVLVTHGGVIRSILSYINQTALEDSFSHFSLHYGCVIKITVDELGVFGYEICSNIQGIKEIHQPTHRLLKP